eukprot:CAMPEP_0172159542 /NCGR_PEP_ID=MMETSP1050-20130122/5030_1 /TAXON_ID=233186 /ORGANISM="Cryptomonas curvata, Strain CCAP979/52" /LENGTH=122 /DNA_ID=CAMNT_0012829145 /DNA_START=92 /DNA_END=457 /DNA_ORIENTATION=-
MKIKRLMRDTRPVDTNRVTSKNQVRGAALAITLASFVVAHYVIIREIKEPARTRFKSRRLHDSRSLARSNDSGALLTIGNPFASVWPNAPFLWDHPGPEDALDTMAASLRLSIKTTMEIRQS